MKNKQSGDTTPVTDMAIMVIEKHDKPVVSCGIEGFKGSRSGEGTSRLQWSKSLLSRVTDFENIETLHRL